MDWNVFYSGLWSIRRTCTVSLVDCRVCGGLEVGLKWTVEYTEDRYWGCSELQNTKDWYLVCSRL